MSDDDPIFHLFGAAHFGAVGVTAVIGLSVILVARSGHFPRVVLWQNVVLGLAMMWSYPTTILTRYATGYSIDDVMLPMHLCDWAAIAGFIAMFWGRAGACEVLYFFGLAGTTQGLLTPAIAIGFPHPTFFAFFLLHSSVVVSALYLPLGLRWRPRPGVYRRMCGWALVYLAAAGFVDFVTGQNYGFLRAKPGESLMNAMGEWPFYIPVLVGLAFAFFAFLSLPFLAYRPFRKGLPPADRS